MSKRLNPLLAGTLHYTGLLLMSAWVSLLLVPLVPLLLVIWIWAVVESMFGDLPDGTDEGRGPWL